MSEVREFIKQHEDFWTTMYGVEKWNEIAENCKSTNPEEFLGSLNETLSWYEENEFTEISLFSDVGDTTPKDFYLEKWLFQTLNPIDETEDKVNSYRETFDKKIKETIPCVTISASFGNYRNLENIKKKNRLICIDIDRYTKSKRKKCNTCVDMQLAKELFMQHPSTLYTGFSCSGDGIYAILRIYDAEKLDEYFEYFKEKFARIGLNIDESCKDYTRLRFFSVDKEAYFNPNAKYYKIPEPKKTENRTGNGNSNHKDNQKKIEDLCDVIERAAIDITSSYDDWMKIGAALYNEFGDYGISYFHRISKFHPDYSVKECEKKFNQCRRVTSVKINTLFYIASSYGVRY